VTLPANTIIRDAERGEDVEAVFQLMTDYLTWAHARLARDFGVDEPPADPTEIRDHLDDYRPPRGRLLIAECDGAPAGVGALRMLENDVAEIKRMYVSPDFRDRHLGSAILDRLLEEAQVRQVRLVRLDTCQFMTDAQRLYASRGFEERPPYEGTEIPERLRQHWIFFERQLA
jgi:N-acetylglutamate synthase-like GNAT family acetyltransferase